MSLDPESVSPSDLIDDLGEFGVVELDHFSTSFADEVIVCRIAVVEFVDVSIVVSRDFAEESGVFEPSERTIDGGSADTASVGPLGEPEDELVGVEVLVEGEHFLDDSGPFLSEAHPLGGEVFAKPLGRAESDFNARQPRDIFNGHSVQSLPVQTVDIQEFSECRLELLVGVIGAVLDGGLNMIETFLSQAAGTAQVIESFSSGGDVEFIGGGIDSTGRGFGLLIISAVTDRGEGV